MSEHSELRYTSRIYHSLSMSTDKYRSDKQLSKCYHRKKRNDFEFIFFSSRWQNTSTREVSGKLFFFHRAHLNPINQLNISRIFYWAKTCSETSFNIYEPIKIAKKNRNGDKNESTAKWIAHQADAPLCQEIKIIWIVVRCDAFNAHLLRTRAILLNFFSSLINSTTEKSFFCAKKRAKEKLHRARMTWAYFLSHCIIYALFLWKPLRMCFFHHRLINNN